MYALVANIVATN